MLNKLRSLLEYINNVGEEQPAFQPETNAISEKSLSSALPEISTASLPTTGEKIAIKNRISEQTQAIRNELGEIASSKPTDNQPDETTGQFPSSQELDKVPQTPQEYYGNALTYIRENAYSYKSVSKEWEAFVEQVQPAIDKAQKISDVYEPLRYLVYKLGDNHSSFQSSEQVKNFEEEYAQEDPTGKITPEGFAYLHIPGLVGDKTVNDKYATTLQEVIKNLDQSADPKGWIVDLREEYGGAIYGVLAGLGPLLGDGIAGYFIDSKGRQIPYSYNDGKADFNNTVYAEVAEPYHLKNEKKIAILAGDKTASAGELLYIPFLGKPNTMTFGEPTAGVPTGNDSHVLSDGSILVITGAISADRTGTNYDSSIPPQVQVKIDWDHIGDEQDPVLKKASEWLKTTTSA